MNYNFIIYVLLSLTLTSLLIKIIMLIMLGKTIDPTVDRLVHQPVHHACVAVRLLACNTLLTMICIFPINRQLVHHPSDNNKQ